MYINACISVSCINTRNDEESSFFEMNEMIECKWDHCLSLALRFCYLVLVVAFRHGSALLLRLF